MSQGPTVYATLMEKSTLNLNAHVGNVVREALRDAHENLVRGMAEDIREAYLAGVADGFREGVATENNRSQSSR